MQQVVEGVQQALLPPDGAFDPTAEILQQVVNTASTTTSTQQQLVQQIAQLQQTVTQMQFQLNSHQQQPPNTDGGGGRGGGRGGGGRGRGGRRAGDDRLRYPRRYNLYCWTHGGCGHLGGRCRDKRPDHQDTATFENKMAGSTNNCPPGNVAPAPGWIPPNANA